MQAAGLAGAVALAGCGGGGGGAPDSGGGNVRPDPNIATPYGAWTENPNALDIAEHWRDAHGLAEALDIEADTGAVTAGFATAHAAARGAGNTSGTILRNVAPARMTPIGTTTIQQVEKGSLGQRFAALDWGREYVTREQRAPTEFPGLLKHLHGGSGQRLAKFFLGFRARGRNAPLAIGDVDLRPVGKPGLAAANRGTQEELEAKPRGRSAAGGANRAPHLRHPRPNFDDRHESTC